MGISATFVEGSKTALVAIAIRDSVYLLDFSVKSVDLVEGKDSIAEHIVSELGGYQRVDLAKFIGAGLPYELSSRSPKLCSRLWLDLDIVPIMLHPEKDDDSEDGSFWEVKTVDEQADSMARKCIM